MPGQLSPQMFKPAQKPRRFRACLSISALLLYFVVALLALGLYAISDACVARNNPGRPPHTLSANCLVALEPVNHARFASGARVIDYLTSPTMPIPSPDIYPSSFVDSELQRHVREGSALPTMPEVALGLIADPRALWSFEGNHGHLTIALPAPVIASTVRILGHHARRSCMPRSVNIWGLVPPPQSSKAHWNLFDWPSGGFPVHLRQEFQTPRSPFSSSAKPRWLPLSRSENIALEAKHTDIAVSETVLFEKLPVHVVSLEFKQNWGANYTCFAGIGVYASVPV